MNAINLTQHPPRGPRGRLGGCPILPRVLDPARATPAGTNDDCKFSNPPDHLGSDGCLSFGGQA